MLPPLPFTTRPEIEGLFGVVASTHWIATAVGMAMLERGGNAFDAAVASAFTLQMVEPHLNGPGGDVPVILWDARAGKPIVICGQGVTPKAATIARFRSLGLDMVPGSGLLAACVPGTFETWMMLLRDFGTMRLRDVPFEKAMDQLVRDVSAGGAKVEYATDEGILVMSTEQELAAHSRLQRVVIDARARKNEAGELIRAANRVDIVVEGHQAGVVAPQTGLGVIE